MVSRTSPAVGPAAVTIELQMKNHVCKLDNYCMLGNLEDVGGFGTRKNHTNWAKKGNTLAF